MLGETETHQAHASAARSVVGRSERKTSDSASADTRGIPLIGEASAQRAFTSGLKPSASRAADGRCIRSSMRLRDK
jgi:hypothetical protein